MDLAIQSDGYMRGGIPMAARETFGVNLSLDRRAMVVGSINREKNHFAVIDMESEARVRSTRTQFSRASREERSVPFIFEYLNHSTLLRQCEKGSTTSWADGGGVRAIGFIHLREHRQNDVKVP
jgi:hypothetical protein